MNNFEQFWNELGAKTPFYEYHGHICLYEGKIPDTPRPPFFAGTVVAKGNLKQWKLLPGAVDKVGEYLPKVQLNKQSTWLVTCGKDVLGQGVQSELPEPGTLVCLQHDSFKAAIGTVLQQTPEENEPAVRVLTHVGSYLRK